MIELKNQELEQTLIQISTYSNPKEGEIQKMISGLLTENITLGTKRALQKIHKAVYKAYTDLQEDAKNIQKECGDDEDRLQKELVELLNESVKIDAEPIKFSSIDNISTSNNYNFDIIEKIAI